jgi:hypothetical protein
MPVGEKTRKFYHDHRRINRKAKPILCFCHKGLTHKQRFESTNVAS